MNSFATPLENGEISDNLNPFSMILEVSALTETGIEYCSFNVADSPLIRIQAIEALELLCVPPSGGHGVGFTYGLLGSHCQRWGKNQ